MIPLHENLYNRPVALLDEATVEDNFRSKSHCTEIRK